MNAMIDDPRYHAIMEAMGSASMCWSNVERAGEFNSDAAISVGRNLYDSLHHLGFPNAKPTFRESLTHIINCHSRESFSNTPDYLLASYLLDCLSAFDRTVNAREAWHGRATSLANNTSPRPGEVPTAAHPLQRE